MTGRIAAGLVAFVAALPAVVPAPAAARDPAGTELFTNCFWAGPRGRDFRGGARQANNYPDAEATYWFAIFQLPAGARLQLRGRYPRARYMSLASYTSPLTGGSVHDTQIAPDRGSTNPFEPGARRTVTKRSWTMTVLRGNRPAHPPRNTFYLGDTPGSAIVYRVYRNDAGTDVAGDAGLPAVTLKSADGSRVSGAAACRALNAPQSNQQVPPPMTLDQWSTLIHTPGLDPRVAPATRRPFFERFFNFAYSFVGDFRPVSRTAPPTDTGGGYSNADTRYLYANLSRRFGKVVVIHGKLPTFADTYPRAKRMSSGEQLRYWSICTNSTPVAGLGFHCATDDELPLRGNRRYTIVISRPRDRPRNATARCGVRWLDYGRQTESPDDPDYGLVIIRNILASPRFKRAAQRITRAGDERKVMGAYYPSPSYTSRSRFERLGCAHAART